MDSLSYILLMAIHLIIALIIALIFKKKKSAFLCFIISNIPFLMSVYLFSYYIHDMYFLAESDGSIQITNAMRIFMLDDHYNSENIITGNITASIYLILGILIFGFWLFKYIRSKYTEREGK